MMIFLSTPSARRATAFKGCSRKLQDISIHALREEGDVRRDRHGRHGIMISIHALREEGDLRHHQPRRLCAPISIHALREEGD